MNSEKGQKLVFDFEPEDVQKDERTTWYKIKNINPRERSKKTEDKNFKCVKFKYSKCNFSKLSTDHHS